MTYLGGGTDQSGALEYDQWNIMLAKRFHVMFKTYRKFSIRFLGIDPDQQPAADTFVPDLVDGEINHNEPDIHSIDGLTEEVKEEVGVSTMNNRMIKKSKQPVPQQQQGLFQMPDEVWSSDVKKILLSHNSEILLKFGNESQGQWKPEQLQIIKLFSESL